MALPDNQMPPHLRDTFVAVLEERPVPVLYETPVLSMLPGLTSLEKKLEGLRDWHEALASLQQEAQRDITQAKEDLAQALASDSHGEDELPTLREEINRLEMHSRTLDSLATDNQQDLEAIEREKKQAINDDATGMELVASERNYSPFRLEDDCISIRSLSPYLAQSETWSPFDDASFAPWLESDVFREASDLDLDFLDGIFSPTPDFQSPDTPPTHPSPKQALSSFQPSSRYLQDKTQVFPPNHRCSTLSEYLAVSPPASSIKPPASEAVQQQSAASTKRYLQEDAVPSPEAKKHKPSYEVDFDELFEEGKAAEKHFIIEHPQDSNDWYIMKCECASHTMHFGEKPLKSAVGHARWQHRNELPDLTFSTIVKAFGVSVLNCDKQKANRNNCEFYIALLDGYKPIGENENATRHRTEAGYGRPEIQEALERLEDAIEATGGYFTRHQQKQRERQCNPGTTEKAQTAQAEKNGGDHAMQTTGCVETSREFPAKVIDPQANRIYCAQASGSWKAMLVLPLPTFQGVPIKKTLQDTALSGRRPFGYEVNLEVGGIEKKGSEKARMVPIMWFDDFEVPLSGEFDPPGLITERFVWFPAAEIWEFEISGSDLPIVGLTAAQKYLKRAENLKLDGQSRLTGPETPLLETGSMDNFSFSWYP